MKLLWNVKYAFGDDTQDETLIVECSTAGTAHRLGLEVARQRRREAGEDRAARIVGLEEAGSVDARSR